MRRAGRGATATAALLMLAGCAASPLATPAEDADGKVFQARPGMGRVYIVHGDLTTSGNTDGTAAAVAGGGVAIGGLVAILGNAMKSDASAKPRPISAGAYFLNGRPLGNMNEGHYLVLDLPPGDYLLGFEHRAPIKAATPGTIPVTVRAGAVSYQKSMLDYGGNIARPFFVLCSPEECQPRVQQGQRIAAQPF